jgi:thiamine-phosphate diphosphorylase
MDRCGVPADSGKLARSRLLDRLVETGVYLVTDDEIDISRMLDALRGSLRAGIRVVQLRCKHGSTREAFEVGLRVADSCHDHGALLLVNDRADIAVALDSQGIHVGQDDLPVAAAREVVGLERLVGVSASYLDEVVAAARASEVDYIGFGAMFPTATKRDAEYAGPALLAQARAVIEKPIVAIGGINASNAAEVIRAGADAVAVVSAVFRAAEPADAVRRLLATVREARER